MYLKTSGQKMPMIVVMINDYGSFLQNHSKYDEEVVALTKECTKYGIVFVITGNAVNELRLKLVQNFKKKITLQLIGEDYSFVFSKARRKKPSNLYGRGLVTTDSDAIYEFQTARICSPEKLNSFIKSFIQKLRKANKVVAPAIPVIPKVVSIEDVKGEIKNISMIPIGISSKTVRPYIYNFEEDIVNIITSKDIELTAPFVVNLIKEIRLLNNVEVILIDLEGIIDKNKYDFVAQFNSITERLNRNLEQKEGKRLLYIILGIDILINNLGTEKELFTQNLNAAKMSSNCNFIVIDTAVKIKAHQFDSWYKNYVTPGKGIYIGNGFDAQFALTYEADRREINAKCGNSFGYVVKKNRPTLIKLLGVEEKGEDDE